jgi:hypothetical protein
MSTMFAQAGQIDLLDSNAIELIYLQQKDLEFSLKQIILIIVWT